LSPKGEFWNRLERALDLSKNVSELAKNDLGNSPLSFDPAGTIPKPLKQYTLFLKKDYPFRSLRRRLSGPEADIKCLHANSPTLHVSVFYDGIFICRWKGII